MEVVTKFAGLKFRYLWYVLLLLPAFIFRDYTPANELKYLSIAEEALNNGNWFVFYNHGEAYADKPPLLLWLIMLSRLVAGGHYMWIVGFFSVLPAIGVLAVMDRWVGREKLSFNPLISNLLLLSTMLFLTLVLTVRMDMLMIFFIVLSLYTFYNLYKERSARKEKYLLPVYLFLAVFSKGALGLLIPVVSILAFLIIKKKARFFGRYLGWRQWLIMLGLFGAWFLLVYLEGGWEYLDNLLFKQTIGRGIDSFHHKEPFWFYFPRMLWTFAPWILLYLVLLWQGVRKRMITSDLEIFFLTITGVTIVMLSLISSKLDIYLLPVCPFVVYLCSVWLMRSMDSKAVKMAIFVPALLFAFALPSIAVFGKKLLSFYFHDAVAIYVGIAFLTAGGVVALVMLWKNHLLKAIIAISGGMFGLLFIGSFALPQLNRHIGFGEMAETARQHADKEDIRHYCYYKFYTGANMDIYLNDRLINVHSVETLDSLHSLPHKSILFVRHSELRREEALKNRLANLEHQWTSGRYSWYLLGGER